jgi:SRSO17 transposase
VELVWRRGSKGLQRGRFLALRVRPAGVTPRRLARAADGELLVRWLLVEWPLGKPEPTKYWLSDLPETTPLVELVGLARLRWRVEQDYRELKGALGLDHFQGRGWVGWHHHVTLVSVAHGFLTLERLRGDAQTSGVGLTLWQLLSELQVLLACWAGACPVCKRPARRWLRRTGRPRVVASHRVV